MVLAWWRRRWSNAVRQARTRAARRRPLAIEGLEDRCVATAGVLQFATALYNVAETGGGVNITVQRVGGSQGTLTAQFSTMDLTATAGSDYQARTGSLTFAPGETSKTFFIPILDDARIEGNETFRVRLTQPNTPSVLARTDVRILDNDGTRNQRFVAQLYLDLLRRPVDPTGLANYTGALNLGASRLQVAQSIQASREYLTVLVNERYLRFLGRPADLNGLTANVNFLASGGRLEQFEAALLGSAEFFQVKGKGTIPGFLDELFEYTVGRHIDAASKQTYTQMLTSGATRTAVARQVLARVDALQFRVNGFYQQFLRRAADTAGLNANVTALQQGATVQRIIANLVSSAEYYGQFI
jgi:hypothetical protein